MARFSGMALTNDGVILQAKVEAGTQLTFTRCASGDGYLPDGLQLKDLTALISEKRAMQISGVTVGAGVATVRAILTNKDLAVGFEVRELGLFATDPDRGEILYAVGNAADTADVLPAYGGSDIVEQVFDIMVSVGSAAQVTAVIDDTIIYASRVDFDEHKNKKVYDSGGVHGFETTQPVAADNGKILQFNNSTNRHEYVQHIGIGGNAHPVASQNAAGFMSATDKARVDNHIGSGGAAHALVSQAAHGFMSAQDKIKIDSLSATASVITLPGGLIMQIGTYVSTTDGRQYFNYPQPFPNACIAVIPGFACKGVPQWDKNTFAIDRLDEVDGNERFCVIAYGY